jgi:N utilization substance protein B
LNALYAADVIGAAPTTAGLPGRVRRYVEGTWENISELDREIEAAATGWRLGRMPAVDRNILRLALYELRSDTTPVGVVVSEAVNLAKRFSTERSGAFVNAVLSKLIEQ